MQLASLHDALQRTSLGSALAGLCPNLNCKLVCFSEIFNSWSVLLLLTLTISCLTAIFFPSYLVVLLSSLRNL